MKVCLVLYLYCCYKIPVQLTLAKPSGKSAVCLLGSGSGTQQTLCQFRTVLRATFQDMVIRVAP